jgi:perosamine synthetase
LPEIGSHQSAAGRPFLPYARPTVTEDDVQRVVEVLRSDWLTTGPMVEQLERAVARYVGAAHAMAVSSGTAALHAAMFALGIGPGDEVIVPAMTFAATANGVVYQGGTPVFADVDPETLLLDPARVEIRITRRTRAIIAVDYAGQPCDYNRLESIARARHLVLVADASHALGAADRGRPVGSLADVSTFSLHAVKPITAGEGGIVTTDDPTLAELIRRFRNHGFSRDHHQRAAADSWYYEMTDLGYNYRLTDVQCALALGQLSKLDARLARRREIARRYDHALAELAGVRPLGVRRGATHGRHLYVVRLDRDVLGMDRAAVFRALRAEGIGVGVHYIPVHLHPFYRERYGTGPGLCPAAEAAYEQILSLPLFPAMTDDNVADVIAAVRKVIGPSRR